LDSIAWYPDVGDDGPVDVRLDMVGGAEVALLIATRTRLYGEALAEALNRAGYQVELLPCDYQPTTIVSAGRARRPDLVLLDVPNLAEALQMAHAIDLLSGEHIRVIVLSNSGSNAWNFAGLGPDGWVIKSDSLCSLLEIIGRWAPLRPLLKQPKTTVSPASATAERKLDGAGTRGFELLTPRERQVLVELMDGLQVAGIAKRFFMSPATVRHHIRSILSKLNVNSQLGAVVAAYQAGWPGRVQTSSPPIQEAKPAEEAAVSSWSI
jgi:two-component system, NarL family, nitrate/nitrite response regulator NarL